VNIRQQTIGIVGDGQLGRMLIPAAKELGFHVVVLGPTENSPSGQYTEQIYGDFRKTEAVLRLGERADFVTFEFEDANAEGLMELEHRGVHVCPSPATLAKIKDKFLQKELLSRHGIPVAPYCSVSSRQDVVEAAERFGYPVVLKARLGSYDGQGNARIMDAGDIDSALTKLEGRELYVEGWVDFRRELSVVAARDIHGNIATYPVVETQHVRDVCHTVIAVNGEEDTGAHRKAVANADAVLDKLEGIGVFGIEMFEIMDGSSVLVNEIAPRVHNSGHWTIEGATTSQFEQHIRAIAGLPLGSTEMKCGAAVMVNILGRRNGPAGVSGLEQALAIPGVSVHIYGKHETRVDRKMGHLTAIAGNRDEALEAAQAARELISI